MALLLARVSKGVDSAGHPSGAALVAAGIGVQCVYLTGNFAVTDAELADYLAHGIWCVALHEVNPKAASGGLGAGKTDMGQAIKAALAHHIPIGAAIILCDDTDAIPYPTVEAYWRGGLTSAHVSGFKAGGYGPHSYCTRALASKAIDVAMVAGAWEDGTPQTGIAIKQSVATRKLPDGTVVDIDEILIPNAPGLLWNTKRLYVVPPVPKPPTPKPPAPKPSPQPTEDNVNTHVVIVTIKQGHTIGTAISSVAYPADESKFAGLTLLMGGPALPTYKLSNNAGKVEAIVGVQSPADHDMTAKVVFSLVS
jgi:hypothetical protein